MGKLPVQQRDYVYINTAYNGYFRDYGYGRSYEIYCDSGLDSMR